MHNLIERIVKGLKVVSASETDPIVEFDISDDAVSAWTDMFGEPPNEKSFSKFVIAALKKSLKEKELQKKKAQ